MRVLTPTSDEKIGRNIRAGDILSVLLAGPFAVTLRDTELLSGEHLTPTLIYCLISFSSGLLTLVIFHIGKNLNDYVSMRELQSVAAASLSTIALTSLLVFSFDRLDFVPRSIPAIHFLALTSLMLLVRVIATRRRDRRERQINRLNSEAQHTLMVGANKFTWFYLRLLDSLNIERTNIVSILDDDARLFGQSYFGHPVIAPPSELHRVILEYEVHGVRVDRVLIAAVRPEREDHTWAEIDKHCRRSDIPVEYLGDVLGIKIDTTSYLPAISEIPKYPARRYLSRKRSLDFSLALVTLIVALPFFLMIALGVVIDLGWPVLFWQKRVGFKGQPFLIYKFRTLRAPFDRRGRFVALDQRESRFGRFLSRTRLNEAPQLWNVLIGDMAFVGPRPLLPADQPSTSKWRLQFRPGLTGWAQVHGGKLVGAEEKGVFDDWYVEHASLWLDASIVFRTVSLLVFGDQQMARKTLSSTASSGAVAGVAIKLSEASALGVNPKSVSNS